MIESEYTVPSKTNSALIIIDVQQDFALKGAPVEIPGTSQVID